MPADPSANEKRPRHFWRNATWLVPALLGALVFLPTLWGSAIYDDRLVFEDERLRDVSAWGRFWSEPYHPGPDNLYRPLGSMSFAVVWWVFGDAWWPQHAVNVLLHAACSALVAVFAGRLTRRPTAAVIAGIAFALHPVHVEAIAMLVGRFELLCTGATLAGLALLVTDRAISIPRALAVTTCFGIALLSKEQGLLFPVLAGVTVLATRGFVKPGIGAAVLLANLGLGLVALVIAREHFLELKFWWSRGFLDPNIQPLVLAEGANRWLMPVELLGRYAGILVWPDPLSIEYGGQIIGRETSVGEPYFLAGAAVALAWVGGCVGSAIARRWDLLALLMLAAIAYGPAANFLTLIGTIFGERLLYMPSAFLAALLGIGVAKLPVKAWVVPGILALAWAGQCVRYAVRWTDPFTYYQ
ncbi:MAG: hypothetical protein AAF743_16325, partial [Planctomycetota bacterium]